MIYIEVKFYEIYSEYEEYYQYVLDTDYSSINAGNVNFDFLVKYFQTTKGYSFKKAIMLDVIIIEL